MHDPATGNLLAEEHAGVTTTHAYDGLSRLLTTHAEGTPPVHVRRLWCDDACPPRAVFRQVELPRFGGQVECYAATNSYSSGPT